MQIAFHIGAHFTDDDRILKCLLKNKGALAKAGTVVPGPSRYRKLLRQTSFALKGSPASPETQETLLDAVMDEDNAERLVLSGPTMLYVPMGILRDGAFYARIANRTAAIVALFPDASPEIFLALQNPATTIHEMGKAAKWSQEFRDLLLQVDPMEMRWMRAVETIQAQVPDARLTVWCNEDAPLIWPEILKAIAHPDKELELTDLYDFAASLMTDEGVERMKSYLAVHPPAGDLQRRQVIGTFLERFGVDDQMEIELDVPDWSEALVDSITKNYEEDTQRIAKLPGVTFLEV